MTAMARSILSERGDERRLCARYGWDLEIFTGKIPISKGDRGDYRIRNADGFLFRVWPYTAALRLVPWHRFGNSVKQLRNVLYAAKMLRVRTIHFAQPHPFFGGSQVGDLELRWGIDDSTLREPCLEGSFFHLDALRLSPTPSETARIFAKLIRPLVRRKIREADPRIRDADLVLHFRSGDAFSTPELAYNHGQPPFSYYMSAIDREQPARVWLVFEDRANPCIDATEAALRSRGVEILVQSGSLEDDLRLLLSARRLVAGRGSFAYWVAHLSERLRRAYFLHKPGRMRALRELGVEIVLAQDLDGEFDAKLLRGNWSGSPAQCALMLSYPAEKLKFSTLKPRARKGS